MQPCLKCKLQLRIKWIFFDTNHVYMILETRYSQNYFEKNISKYFDRIFEVFHTAIDILHFSNYANA